MATPSAIIQAELELLTPFMFLSVAEGGCFRNGHDWIGPDASDYVRQYGLRAICRRCGKEMKRSDD